MALFGFGAATWKIAPRDRFIGWGHATRERNLPAVVNNTKHLLLPWFRVRCLASHLLSLVTRHLPEDWLDRNRLCPIVLETLRDTTR